MRNRILTIAIMALLLLGTVCQAGAEVKIGVLAKDGPAKALKKWSATGEYLTAKIGQPVAIVPLGFDKVFPAVEAGEVDFFLVNSSMFVTAKVKYGAVPVATMINSRQGKALRSFGGVVFTTAYNEQVNSFDDLKGKKFAAVKKSSFGGWQMAYKEFIDAGIDPFKDFGSLEFSGKHDNVVFAVQNEQVEAGTVRTDTLERMAAEGAIAMEDFKIIGKKESADFPFVCSTQLYPEWPLAKVAATDDGLATKVVAALKELKAEDQAAKAAKIVGWADTLDYSSVEALQQSLQVGAFEE
ncbi:MAG: PhnD/SsuA/transferrin family substrate-binding protein [Desulforhopalus sp.]